MISHGHGDHVLGLPSFIGCRNSARGDREKPLQIYYPAGDKNVESVRDFIFQRNGNLRYNVEWFGIHPGCSVDLGNNQSIVSFEMQHQKYNKTLGYRIVEKRSKLRPEYMGTDIPTLLRGGSVTSEQIKMWYSTNIFVYALDAFHVNQEDLKDADIAVMDCTFLKEKDRDDMTHFTLSEAWELCGKAGVKKMIAAHFSPRYLYPMIKEAVEFRNMTSGPHVVPVFHNQVLEV